MRKRLTKLMTGWYFRNAYRPTPLNAALLPDHPVEHFIPTVSWISTRETLCQSTALQMIAAHHGIEQPRPTSIS